ncbi:hypothetical protein HAX54_039436 [Datura stramonium]|uniref:Uncharacterized protein n=1 Tax=Datura stramonium TaxID=4076 RepID=A0ABS8VLY8_DATST|nr:hypothetical protein [Datura stramonium]
MTLEHVLTLGEPHGRGASALLRASPSHPRRTFTCVLGDKPTLARKASRNTKLIAFLSCPIYSARGWACASFETKTTLGNGYLSFRFDEEHSKIPYLGELRNPVNHLVFECKYAQSH